MSKIVVILVSALIFVTGCSNMPGVYKLDIPQGNYISKAEINRIRPGMSRKQVRYILGTPMIIDTFRNNRWDYIYSFRKGGKKTITTKRVSLFFSGDRVTKIEGDLKPEFDDSVTVLKRDRVVKIKTTKKKKRGFIKRMIPFTGGVKKKERKEKIEASQQAKADESQQRYEKVERKKEKKRKAKEQKQEENTQNFSADSETDL